jgi:hypothetical protein
MRAADFIAGTPEERQTPEICFIRAACARLPRLIEQATPELRAPVFAAAPMDKTQRMRRLFFHARTDA